MIKQRLILGSVAVLCWVLMATVSIAETKYVVEEFEITMRTGPGVNNKIIALIPSGRQVDVLTQGEEWTEVQLASGKQGWVLTRYLTDELPSAIKLERIEQKYTRLLDQHKTLDQSASELGSAKRELTGTLSNTQAQLADLQSAHEALQKEAANVITLKKKYDAAVKDLKETRSHSEKVENELNRLSNSQVYQGMLYGGGLLAIGFIVGFIVKRPKRRSPLL